MGHLAHGLADAHHEAGPVGAQHLQSHWRQGAAAVRSAAGVGP